MTLNNYPVLSIIVDHPWQSLRSALLILMIRSRRCHIDPIDGKRMVVLHQPCPSPLHQIACQAVHNVLPYCNEACRHKGCLHRGKRSNPHTICKEWAKTLINHVEWVAFLSVEPTQGSNVGGAPEWGVSIAIGAQYNPLSALLQHPKNMGQFSISLSLCIREGEQYSECKTRICKQKSAHTSTLHPNQAKFQIRSHCKRR